MTETPSYYVHGDGLSHPFLTEGESPSTSYGLGDHPHHPQHSNALLASKRLKEWAGCPVRSTATRRRFEEWPANEQPRLDWWSKWAKSTLKNLIKSRRTTMFIYVWSWFWSEATKQTRLFVPKGLAWNLGDISVVGLVGILPMVVRNHQWFLG